MIRARLSLEGETARLAVTGHARTAPKGEDLVCAAVSALVETLALGLARYDPQGVVTLGEGSFRYEGQPDRTARAILDTFRLGFEDLARTEPRAISFRVEE